jgi:hypothetical protein
MVSLTTCERILNKHREEKLTQEQIKHIRDFLTFLAKEQLAAMNS